MSQKNEITPELIAEMAKDCAWEAWAEAGWTLELTHHQQARAVHEGRRLATASGKKLPSLIRRLLKNDYAYGHFVTHQKRKMS